MVLSTQLDGWRARWAGLRAQRWRWRPFMGPQGLYLGLPQHWPVQAAAADAATALADALAAFEAWCAAHPGERCELALGSAATLWQVVHVEGRGPQALAQAWGQAFQTWAHYLDIDLQDPAVLAQWQLQEASLSGTCLLAATPLALTQGLLDVAAAHGVKVDWMGAWWLRGLARSLQASPPADQDQVQDGALPLQDNSLWLAEPGCCWRASRQPAAHAGAGRWTLSQLSMDASGAEQGQHTARVTLQAPGAGGEHATCVAVDLALLRGVSPTWSLTWR